MGQRCGADERIIAPVVAFFGEYPGGDCSDITHIDRGSWGFGVSQRKMSSVRIIVLPTVPVRRVELQERAACATGSNIEVIR